MRAAVAAVRMKQSTITATLKSSLARLFQNPPAWTHGHVRNPSRIHPSRRRYTLLRPRLLKNIRALLVRLRTFSRQVTALHLLLCIRHSGMK